MKPATRVELDDMYVIQPAHPWWSKRTGRTAQPLPDGFRYASDTNPHWLTVGRIARTDRGQSSGRGEAAEEDSYAPRPRGNLMTVTPASSEALAIHGGSPVRKTLLPYGRQSIDEDDIQAVVETLRSDWLTTGPKVAEFEEALAAWVGAKYAVSFSSGTAALHAAAFAAGLKPGDEAITSPLTFAATANCVLYQGATSRLRRCLAGHAES